MVNMLQVQSRGEAVGALGRAARACRHAGGQFASIAQAAAALFVILQPFPSRQCPFGPACLAALSGAGASCR